MQWYYAVNGQQQGPVDWDALVALAREGKLKPSDLVWNSTMGNQWSKAALVPGLFDPITPTASDVPPSAAEWSSTAKFKSATHNRDLMKTAREALVGRWGAAVGATVVYLLLMIAASAIPFLNILLNLLVVGPLMVGLCAFFLAMSRRRVAGIELLFDGFKQFGTAFLSYLLIGLLIFAWMLPALAVALVTMAGVIVGAVRGVPPDPSRLLLVVPLYLAALIPAMIAQYRYFMTFYVISEMPGVGPMEAIRHSKQMMHGNKWKLFCLQWRFFGWILLCVLSLGIGFLWLFPYMMTSVSCFYDDLRKGQTNN